MGLLSSATSPSSLVRQFSSHSATRLPGSPTRGLVEGPCHAERRSAAQEVHTPMSPSQRARPPARLTYCPSAPYKMNDNGILVLWVVKPRLRGGMSQVQGDTAEKWPLWDWKASSLAPEGPAPGLCPTPGEDPDTASPRLPFPRTLRPQGVSCQPAQPSPSLPWVPISCPGPSTSSSHHPPLLRAVWPNGSLEGAFGSRVRAGEGSASGWS